MSTPDIKEVVREKYGQAARRVQSGADQACCRSASALGTSWVPQIRCLPVSNFIQAVRTHRPFTCARLYRAPPEDVLASL